MIDAHPVRTVRSAWWCMVHTRLYYVASTRVDATPRDGSGGVCSLALRANAPAQQL
jgi:hypothetical protein